MMPIVTLLSFYKSRNWLPEFPVAVNLAERTGKEVGHYSIKLILFKYWCGMARVGDDP